MENASRLNAIIEAAIDGIITIDQRGTIETINPAVSRIFGYSAEEVIGKNIKTLMPEPDHSQHDQYLKNHQQTGIKKIIGIGREVKGKRKNGDIFPFRLSVTEVNLGERIIYTGIIHDITDLKKTEDALRESENKISAIINTAVDGIITINERGVMEMINPSAAKIFGYSQQELLGQRINILMPPPDREQHDTYIQNFRNTGIKKIIGIGREVTGLKKDGTRFPFFLSVSEITYEGRNVYTGFIHDITIQKEHEARLIKYADENAKNIEEIKKLNVELEERVQKRTAELFNAIKQLEDTNKKQKLAEVEVRKALEKEKELNELKSRFVTLASHEFRTPLSTILSSASLISKYNEIGEAEKLDKHTTRIKSAVTNLTGILNDFLSLSKLEEGVTSNNPSNFNLDELAEEVKDEFMDTLKENQQLITTHSGDQNVFLDKQIARNILLNLVSNAIKYSEKGTIEINTTVSPERITLRIKDEGIGIPDADKVHLFTRFFRAHNAGNIQGTGLGLNIVKRYAELLNGKIEFESTVNKGTTFTVEFPNQSI